MVNSEKKASIFCWLSLFKIITRTLRSNNYFCHGKQLTNGTD